MAIFLITGISSGIGHSLALELLKDGNMIFGISRTEGLSKEIMRSPNFHFLSLDLSKTDSIEPVLLPFIKDTKFDGLVHCAGMEETLPISQYRPDKVETILRTNVFSAIELLRVFSKKRHSLDNSSVVFLSSVMGELGQAGKVGYCSSKAAILGIVKSSALELAKRGIRVNAVSPGVVNTPMTQRLFSLLSPESVDDIVNKHPLGLGEPSDITSIIRFLLSEESKWLTGQNLIVDGGYSIH